ncbi:Gfo/Idh/MocA family protein [Chloroflexota bacterium]
MTNKLRVGIVGCGLVTEEQHIPSFRRLKRDVILQAVCDRNEALAKQTALKYGLPGAYVDLAEMLSKENLDIVDICTPPQTHTPLVVQAVEHGCHVLLEKPMALKTSDCDRMIEAANKHGVKLCVIHNIIFDSLFLEARRLVAGGAIGRFIGMRIFMSDPREEMIMKGDHWIHKLPGGVIGETGPHAAYMSLAFLGKVEAVDVFARNFLEHSWAPFDEFRIEMEGEEAVSSVAISYSSNRRNLYIEILGTDGALYLDLPTMLMIRQGSKRSMGPIATAGYISDLACQVARGVTANAFKVVTGRIRYGHNILIEEFVNSVIDGRQPPVTGEDGREATRVIEMVVERLHQKYGDAYKTK